MFEIGERVICVGCEGTPNVDWDYWASYWKIARPVRGGIYTVRATRIAKDGTQRVRLSEIVNPPAEFSDAPKQEPWFQSIAFRPVRRTDISIFEKILVEANLSQNETV